ncbi:hypothetical protein ACFYPZ_17565 [Streptomyces sp. NPDC005506]|uniref:hypothetical protein n=1 Tax=unclassified Streptomyces TaxID=2593676 RepID=UPI0036AC20E8
MSVQFESRTDVARGDVGLVKASTWDVGAPARQRQARRLRTGGGPGGRCGGRHGVRGAREVDEGCPDVSIPGLRREVVEVRRVTGRRPS